MCPWAVGGTRQRPLEEEEEDEDEEGERERGTHEPDALGKQLHDLDRQVAHLAHEPHRVGAEPGAVGLGGPGRLLVARELEPHLERLFRVWVARRGPDLGVLRAGAERGEGRRGGEGQCVRAQG